MTQSKKVNCFLAGSPKCGTTALVKYLSDHKGFIVSSHKESNYFMHDAPNIRHVKNEKEYNLLFNDFKSDAEIFCDASIFYTHSEVALKNIHDYNKEAKIILMFRDPMEMIPSFHTQLLYTLEEDISDIEQAWKAEAERKKKNLIPQHSRESKLLYYSEIAKYSKHLQEVHKYFPKDQVKVVLFDDFKASTVEVYKDVLHFLDLPYDGRTEFLRVNEAKKAKSSLINRFVNRPPKVLKSIARILLKILNKPRFGILEKLDNFNRTKHLKQELSEEMKQHIRAAYREDVDALAKLINRDLSAWLQ